MKVTEKKYEQCQAILTIEADEQEFKAAQEAAYKEAAKNADIPGFRKGKAPRHLLEQHFGKDKIQAQAIENLAPDLCQKAILEEKINYIGRPRVEIVQQEPVILKAVISLPPEIKLGDYKKLKSRPEKVKISAGEVNKTLEDLRKQAATWVPVDRPVTAGDLIMVDLEGTIEGQPFINEKGSPYAVQPEKQSHIKGLAENLVGMKAGEQKTFDVQLSKDYPVAEKAGKTVNFNARVLEVKQEDLPELNDELAQKFDPDLKSLADLKKRLKNNLEARANQKATHELEVKLLDELLEASSLEYPPALLENEIEKAIEEQVRQWRMYSRTEEDFKNRLAQTSYEKLKEKFKASSEQRLRRSLVLTEFIRQENITASKKEIDAEIERIASQAGDKKEERRAELDGPEARSSIGNDIITAKAFEKLVELVSGTGAKPAKESEKTEKAPKAAKAKKTTKKTKAKGASKEEKDE